MSTVVSAKKSSIPKKRERRKERRQIVFARYPVLVSVKNSQTPGSEPIAAMLTDISTKGLGLIAGVQLFKGTEVVLTLSAGTPNEMQLVAKAAWASPLPSSGLVLKQSATSNALEASSYWRIGLAMNTEDKKQLALVEQIMRQL